jgi:hypothetical protein
MGRNLRHRNGKGQTSGVVMNATGGNGTNGGTATMSTESSSRTSALDAALKHHQQIKARIDSRTKSSSRIRTIILAILCVYFIVKNMHQYFFPYGPAVVTLPTSHAEVDMSNDLLRFRHNKTQKIVTSMITLLRVPKQLFLGMMVRCMFCPKMQIW